MAHLHNVTIQQKNELQLLASIVDGFHLKKKNQVPKTYSL